MINLVGNANADKLFESLVIKLKKISIDMNKEFTLLEIAEFIPRGTANVNDSATYNYSIMSMFSKQKNRDYFIFQNTSVQDKLTHLANKPSRNNAYWKTNYANEKLMINPKYLEQTVTLKSNYWEIITNEIALKSLDRSTFIHNETVIPKEIRSFFGITELRKKEKIEIKLFHHEKAYYARIEIDNKLRSKMTWKADFSSIMRESFPNEYSSFKTNNAEHSKNVIDLKFEKVSNKQNTFTVDFYFVNKEGIEKDIDAEETELHGPRTEGNAVMYYGKRYERDSMNRKLAIEYHGLSCIACGFNFEEKYGERGKDFIEVHHVKPLSTLNIEMIIDPKKDLVPLCSNCHRIVHRRKDDVLSIEALKKTISSN